MKKVTVITEETTLKELLEIIGGVEKAGKMPTPKALRERKHEDGTVEQIAPIAATDDGTCKVYANGYAVYGNASGVTVMWLPDCRTFTYRFNDLKDNEKEYLPQKSTVEEEVMESLPWFMAVMVRGDHQVEENSYNRKGDKKDEDQNVSLDQITEKEEEESEWNPGYRFENPERAYLRKEALEEQLGKLTDKQREVFVLYHRDGFNQYEITDMLGISHQAVDYRLAGAENKVRLSAIHF